MPLAEAAISGATCAVLATCTVWLPLKPCYFETSSVYAMYSHVILYGGDRSPHRPLSVMAYLKQSIIDVKTENSRACAGDCGGQSEERSCLQSIQNGKKENLAQGSRAVAGDGRRSQ